MRRADETFSHDADLDHTVMGMLMEVIDTRCGWGCDAACRIEALLLDAFQAASEGDEDRAAELVERAVDVMTDD